MCQVQGDSIVKELKGWGVEGRMSNGPVTYPDASVVAEVIALHLVEPPPDLQECALAHGLGDGRELRHQHPLHGHAARRATPGVRRVTDVRHFDFIAHKFLFDVGDNKVLETGVHHTAGLREDEPLVRQHNYSIDFSVADEINFGDLEFLKEEPPRLSNTKHAESGESPQNRSQHQNRSADLRSTQTERGCYFMSCNN